jgi:hypothetical protein
MPFPIHDIDLVDGSTPNLQDRLIAGLQLAVANAAGGSAGTAVSFPAGSLPPSYAVFVEVGQGGVMAAVTSKTSSGFNVVLTPLSTVTVAAGSFNVWIVG